MAINSLNMAMSASSYGAYNLKLTQATADKLNELGIIYNPNITEAQGRQLLKSATASQNTQNNKNESKNNNERKTDVFQKALELAQKLGIDTNKELSFEELITLIEETLEIKIQSAKNDEKALKELRSLSETLAAIQAENTGSLGFDATNKALEMSLELLGEYNKSFLG